MQCHGNIVLNIQLNILKCKYCANLYGTFLSENIFREITFCCIAAVWLMYTYRNIIT